MRIGMSQNASEPAAAHNGEHAASRSPMAVSSGMNRGNLNAGKLFREMVLTTVYRACGLRTLGSRNGKQIRKGTPQVARLDADMSTRGCWRIARPGTSHVAGGREKCTGLLTKSE